MTTVTGEVDADYSQIELHHGDGGMFPAIDVGLVSGELSDYLVLVTPRHHGPVTIDVEAATSWSDAPDTATERYLLQLWPAPMSDARTVAATTPWSQYWAFGPAAEALVAELEDVPDPDRLEIVIDRALADHPDVTARLRDGQDAYQGGIVRYAQTLFRLAHATSAYTEIQHDSDALRQLIAARVERTG